MKRKLTNKMAPKPANKKCRLHLITPSDDEVVSVSEAKAFLRVTSTTDDAVILAMINAVAEWLAGANGWLGRSLAPTDVGSAVPVLPLRLSRREAAAPAVDRRGFRHLP